MELFSKFISTGIGRRIDTGRGEDKTCIGIVQLEEDVFMLKSYYLSLKGEVCGNTMLLKEKSLLKMKSLIRDFEKFKKEQKNAKLVRSKNKSD